MKTYVWDIAEKAIEDKYFSGCAIAKFNMFDQHSYYYGHHSQNKKIEISSKSIFDLASLTKVLATGSFIAEAFEKKTLTVSTEWQEKKSRKYFSLQDLLSHQAGFMAWEDFRSLCREDKTLLKEKIFSKSLVNSATLVLETGTKLLMILLYTAIPYSRQLSV